MNQEYLLSNNKEHEKLYDDFLNDLNLWSASIFINNQLQHRAKSCSTMLTSCYIYFYDHPVLLEQYPYGFHTKNMMFISINQYQKMLELEPLAMIDEDKTFYWNLSGLLTIPSLVGMMEEKYPVIFSYEEIQKIISSFCENVFAPRQRMFMSKEQIKIEVKEYQPNDYISIDQNMLISLMNNLFEFHRPEFITHQELINLAINLKLNSVEYLKKIDEDNNFIDYALLKNTEIYDKNHPFNRLISHIKIPNNSVDILSFEKESLELQKFLKIHSYQLYSAFNTLSYQIVKESDNVETLLKKLDGAWINTALKCPVEVFGQAVEILYKNCLMKFANEDNSSVKNEILEKMAHFINAHENFYSIHRSELIEKITQYSTLVSTVRCVPLKTNKP